MAIYSYFVYLMGEVGVLNAYGITDATALVTLEAQNIIPGFLKAILFFIITTLLLFILVGLTSRGERSSGGVYQSLGGKLALVALTGVTYLVALPKMRDDLGGWTALLSGIFFVLLITVFIFVKIPGLKSTFPSWGEGMLDSLLINDKDGTASLKRLLVAGAILSVIFVPTLGYFINYNSVATENHKIVKLTQINGISYDLVRQYSDKNIFIQIKDGAYVASYSIQRGGQLDEVNYRTEYLDGIDRSALFPKPESTKQVNELLRNFIKSR